MQVVRILRAEDADPGSLLRRRRRDLTLPYNIISDFV
jgi:hypothetical protein